MRTFTVEEVARHYSVSERTVWRWVAERKVRTVKRHGRTLICALSAATHAEYRKRGRAPARALRIS
jgi:excisionase family DNA binding protein